MDIRVPKPSQKVKHSHKGRQIVAHRAKHARYRSQGRLERNKARRALTQKYREAKQAAKKTRRAKS